MISIASSEALKRNRKTVLNRDEKQIRALTTEEMFLKDIAK